MSRVEHSAAGLLAARFVKRPRDLRRARRCNREIAFFQKAMAENADQIAASRRDQLALLARREICAMGPSAAILGPST